MRNTIEESRALLKNAFEMWIKALGLAWWDIKIVYYDTPEAVLERFAPEDSSVMVRAFVDTLWAYGEAKIEINLLAFSEAEPHEIDKTVVHELIHILVNEMREKELCHEERVVTNLTRAFFWALDAVERAHEEETPIDNG